MTPPPMMSVSHGVCVDMHRLRRSHRHAMARACSAWLRIRMKNACCAVYRYRYGYVPVKTGRLVPVSGRGLFSSLNFGYQGQRCGPATKSPGHHIFY